MGYVATDGLPITVLANEDADVLFNTVETCVSGAGYTIEFPAVVECTATPSDN